MSFDMHFSPFLTERTIFYSYQRKIPQDFYPKKFFLLRSSLYRQYLNMNTFIIIVGAVRTGKSYFGLKFAEEYCKAKKIPFDVKKQCSFDIKPFLEWSQGSQESVYVLDEVGVNLNPQEWYSIQAKVMRNFTQAQGFRKNVLIMVLPNVAFLLKSIRFMGNYMVETIKQGLVKTHKIQMVHSLGKGWLEYIGTIKFDLPSRKTIEEYEQMKKEWNDEHLKEDINYMEMLDQPSEKELKRQEYYDLRLQKIKLDLAWKKEKMKQLRNKKVKVW